MNNFTEPILEVIKFDGDIVIATSGPLQFVYDNNETPEDCFNTVH